MMKSFKDILLQREFNRKLYSESVSVTSRLTGHVLAIRFDQKDKIIDAAYEGRADAWLESMCALLQGKTLDEAQHFTWRVWENEFSLDQTFWDLRQEQNESIFFESLELLKAAIDIFRGRENLYQEADPLICRCFGVRERDVLDYLKNETAPTLEALAVATKAGMGCRSCVPQLQRWLFVNSKKQSSHYFKERTYADWLIQMDYILSCFPQSQEWKMEIESFKDQMVIITYSKEVSQTEAEEVGRSLQKFMSAALDEELAFFLRFRSLKA